MGSSAWSDDFQRIHGERPSVTGVVYSTHATDYVYHVMVDPRDHNRTVTANVPTRVYMMMRSEFERLNYFVQAVWLRNYLHRSLPKDLREDECGIFISDRPVAETKALMSICGFQEDPRFSALIDGLPPPEPAPTVWDRLSEAE